jgi:hypothetical protein
MIEEGDVMTIQCKKSFGRLEFTRKVNVLSLIFIDFYVPTLTLRLNSTETSLQLSIYTHIYNMTFIPIARQRLGKHISAKRKHATEWRPLLGNGRLNTYP